MMLLINILITFVAAILGGTMNGIAGGGSFLTFPSLIYAGVAPIQANATSTTALWPGSAAAVWALRKELLRQNKTLLLVLGGTSVIGGILGAVVLLVTPQETFVQLIPYLLLMATALFALSPLVNARIKQRITERRKRALTAETAEYLRDLEAIELPGQQKEVATNAPTPSLKSLTGIAFLQLIIALYGGYFGGGIGILMLASLGLMGIEDIHEMNAIKNTLAACINGVAVITFIVAGAVIWFNALTMIAGAIIGGYGGVYYARKLNPRLVRGFIILVGSLLTVYFFYKYGFF